MWRNNGPCAGVHCFAHNRIVAGRATCKSSTSVVRVTLCILAVKSLLTSRRTTQNCTVAAGSGKCYPAVGNRQRTSQVPGERKKAAALVLLSPPASIAYVSATQSQRRCLRLDACLPLSRSLSRRCYLLSIPPEPDSGSSHMSEKSAAVLYACC